MQASSQAGSEPTRVLHHSRPWLGAWWHCTGDSQRPAVQHTLYPPAHLGRHRCRAAPPPPLPCAPGCRAGQDATRASVLGSAGSTKRQPCPAPREGAKCCSELAERLPGGVSSMRQARAGHGGSGASWERHQAPPRSRAAMPRQQCDAVVMAGLAALPHRRAVKGVLGIGLRQHDNGGSSSSSGVSGSGSRRAAWRHAMPDLHSLLAECRHTPLPGHTSASGRHHHTCAPALSSSSAVSVKPLTQASIRAERPSAGGAKGPTERSQMAGVSSPDPVLPKQQRQSSAQHRRDAGSLG